jgi:hypothetical protein
MKKIYAVTFSLIAYAARAYFYVPEPTLLSLRIGLPFEEVVRTSTFPVIASSNNPANDPEKSGITLVTKPAVIIKFSDPKYGFTLPATTFAGVSYSEGKVSTIRTSPMLRKLPFHQAVSELANLQSQFQMSGWLLDDDTAWFDLTHDGRRRLHEDLRSGRNGRARTVSLVAPNKYSLYFTISCAGGCDSKIGLDRYLIDISVSEAFGH